MIVATPQSALAVDPIAINPAEIKTGSTAAFTISNFELDFQGGTNATCEAPIEEVVKFGALDATGESAVVTFGTTDIATITGTIPSSSVEALDVDVEVSFKWSCNDVEYVETQTIADFFDYLVSPVLGSSFPAGGLEGTELTILGNNFASGGTDLVNEIWLGAVDTGIEVTDFTVNSATSITAIVPAGTGDALSVVLLRQGTVLATKSGTTFSYTSLDRSTAKTGSGPGNIIISNIELGYADCTAVGSIDVEVGGTDATAETASALSGARGTVTITATLPVEADEIADLDVVVKFIPTCDGTAEPLRTVTLESALSYFDAPTITALNPTSGGAGTVVTITGENFDNTTAVKFGSTNALSFTPTINPSAADTITATVPAGVGEVTVSVTSNGLTVTTTTIKFTYTQLAITKISPATGPITGGQLVTIEGTGLKGVTSVLFGSTPGTTISVVTEGSKITVLSPAVGTLPTSPVDVSVITALDAFTATGAYRYVAAPTITKYDATGPVQGGSIIKVEGTNFFGGTGELEVKFGTALATTIVLAADGKSMDVVLPAKVTADANKVKLTVKNTAGGPVTATGDFEYLVPAITSLSPSSGPLAGGNVVTITGVSFTGATEVSFGTSVIAKANFISATDTSIRVLAPAATVGGTVAVTVKISASLSGLKADGYTYSTGPSNLVVTPKIGVLAGGTTVTITGANLAGTTKVRFGTKDGTTLVVAPAGTSLTVKTPAGTTLGLVDVAIVGPAGTTILPAAFEYVEKVCTAAALGQIRFEQGSDKLTAKAKANLTALAAAIKTSGCEIVTITTYKFKGTSSLQKQMTKLTNSRILKAKNFLNKALTAVSLLVTYERITLTTQKTTFTSPDQFKVNRVLKFGTK